MVSQKLCGFYWATLYNINSVKREQRSSVEKIQGREREVTSEEEEEEAHDESVSKVEERADKSFNLKLGGIEVDTVDEEIDGCESTRHERPPPPVIVLTTYHITLHRYYYCY